MTDSDDVGREYAELCERISTLNAAILRINASLDLDTVLGEAVDSACGLIGAPYGIITTIDETGGQSGSVYSGFSEEQRREMLALPDKVRLFEHLRALPGPVQAADLRPLVRSLGLEPCPVFSRAFQGAPLRHREIHLGHFFLAEKPGGEACSDEDEEVLMLFSSQSAAAVANARARRSERRAQARLEALVETAPVGVVVFDAGSGRPVTRTRSRAPATTARPPALRWRRRSCASRRGIETTWRYTSPSRPAAARAARPGCHSGAAPHQRREQLPLHPQPQHFLRARFSKR